MPKKIIRAVSEHISKDIALQKTITYRVIVAVGGASIIGVSWLLTSNPLITVLGGSLASEGFRTGVYYVHEKWWNGRTVQTKK
jgi:uncharacterized membrane protein